MSVRTKSFDPEQSLGFVVNRAARAFAAALSARLPDGMTSAQMAVLADIRRYPGSAQRDVCERTGADAATMAELLRRLEKRGMVVRQRDERDARRFQLSVADDVLPALDLALSAAMETNRAASEGLTKEEAAQLRSLLLRVTDNLAGSR